MNNKHFKLSDERLEILNQVKKNNKLKTDVAAINYLLDEYKNEKEKQNEKNELAETFIQMYEKKFFSYMERLKWATKTSEKNTIIMLDILNTVLIKYNIKECVPTDTYVSPAIATSQEIYKKKLIHFKQEKDNRNKKKS